MSTQERDPRRRALDDAERALWHRIARSIKPLKRRRAKVELAEAEPNTPKAKSAPPARRPQAAAPRTAPAPRLPPPLMPLERRYKQRLARGSEPIDRRIDLHGRTQSEAYAALLRCMQKAQADGAKTVLVITGKGARPSDFASERGVLKRQVPHWLALPEFRAYVLGVEEAHIAHGGTGALYVRVRRKRGG